MRPNGRIRLALICALVGVMCLSAAAQYGGGSGTADDPYLIFTAEDMVAFAGTKKDHNKHFRLMANIDLGAYTGTEYPNLGFNWGGEFSGVFDGNGKTISNFTYTCADSSYVGLFAIVNSEGRIENLRLVDPNVSAVGGSRVGALTGMCQGVLANCYVTNATVSGMFRVGGLAGSCWSLSNCHADGTVTGDKEVGGLAGCVWDTVTRCSAEAETVGRQYVGGLTGWNYGRLDGCFSVGVVSGESCVGGLTGYNEVVLGNSYSLCRVNGYEYVGGLIGEISWLSFTSNCYSAGKVTGTSDVGGLIGINYPRVYGIPDAVRACFWDTQTSGRAESDGGTGLPTTQMKTVAIFLDAGWDFVGETTNGTNDLWQMPSDCNYPRLWWEQNDPNESLFGPPWVDNFEDGFAEPLWSFWKSADNMASLVESNGVLAVWTGGSFECPAALYVSKDWLLDTTEDFAMKVDYYLAPDGPHEGWVSIGLTLDPLDPYRRFVDLDATCIDGERLYKVRRNNENIHRTWWAERESEVGTLYLSYDAEKDELYQSFTGFGAEEAWNTVSGLVKGEWQGVPVYVTIGGGSFGGMALDVADAWLDNFSVDSGAVIW